MFREDAPNKFSKLKKMNLEDFFDKDMFKEDAPKKISKFNHFLNLEDFFFENRELFKEDAPKNIFKLKHIELRVFFLMEKCSKKTRRKKSRRSNIFELR